MRPSNAVVTVQAGPVYQAPGKEVPRTTYGFAWNASPRGSKDPNNRALGPKYYTINGIWALKPYHLGPWTLRISFTSTGSSLPPEIFLPLTFNARGKAAHLQFSLGCW